MVPKQGKKCLVGKIKFPLQPKQLKIQSPWRSKDLRARMAMKRFHIVVFMGWAGWAGSKLAWAQLSLGWTWFLKLDSINKVARLGLGGIKPKVCPP